MLLRHFFVQKIAHSSYLLAGSDACAVIDPERDTGIYLDAARELGVRITHVLQTHLHADFVSGHRDLAEETGAAIYASRSAGCAFPHVGVGHGDLLTLEHMTLEVMETPGHTPEHVCFVLRDGSRSEDPVGVFTGDALFVGDVGRPDLFPSRATELAEALHASLHEKLLLLPDYCEVYPAHGAGSLCGRSMSSKRHSTIGYERHHNGALQITNRDEFVRALTTDMPEVPDHFSRCSEVNRQGPVLVAALASPVPMDPKTFNEAAALGTTVVVDTRDYDAFGGQHVPGALSLPLGGNFPIFAGWIVPPGSDILLVADDEMAVEDAVLWLQKVGHDRVVGYLDGGMFEWTADGLPTAHVPQLSSQELHDRVLDEGNRVIVDVRGAKEFGQSHIRSAVNIPAADLRTRHRELPLDRPLITVCSTGQRSSMAASLLLQRGFAQVRNASGGMRGYGAAAYAPRCVMCSIPHGPQFIVSREE
ncbi:MBL fold metallo-hydrolase [Candidatus Fermentibacteria bacterium]|nr:MBL fold metallo-hydrolase [Candidatus Fermentibacteria bacterium]